VVAGAVKLLQTKAFVARKAVDLGGDESASCAGGVAAEAGVLSNRESTGWYFY